MSTSFEARLAAWYAANARDLPWRQPGTGAWSVMVSEFMLQQTPVARVLPAYHEWLRRWPAPAALAAATPADAVRQWGRLGYPRRAIRLHEAAQVMVRRYGGEVPGTLADLRALPGVGSYTAAAVASFAFGQRHPVLDTNVRRVLARLVGGHEQPAGSTASVAETELARSLLPPAESNRAARWSVALMELGALVCTSARPACGQCPVAADCAWRGTGSPAGSPARRQQRYQGSDRQARGAILAALRTAEGPVTKAAIDTAWPDPAQRARALAALTADRLIEDLPDGRIALPGDT
ncbi:MAG TPA: A/G-specific adenine glycosylase [Streptosporangiaceae bacterium]|nr:A/G-specific adenine glycosylase [Streptosporangiaceae bacterium]